MTANVTLVYEGLSVFLFSLFYFFEKTVIAPAASGVLSCDTAILQQGAHLRQPACFKSPETWLGCVGAP